jgi:hypothetical protein
VERTITARLDRKLTVVYFKDKERVLCEAGNESVSSFYFNLAFAHGDPGFVLSPDHVKSIVDKMTY